MFGFTRRNKGPAEKVLDAVRLARLEIRQGRFQRSMAVIASFAAIVSGFEAYAQHQRGAFANRWMWTPVWLTLPVVGSAGAALFSETAARRVLPVVSVASLADGLMGFALHIRGITRLPGGFNLGRYNVVMGPPVFAPLLVGTVGILGLFASVLRPEDLRLVDAEFSNGHPRWHLPNRSPSTPKVSVAAPVRLSLRSETSHGFPRLQSPGSVEAEIAHGRFQQGMALTAALLAILSGGEAYFEHLRGSYNQLVMWTPVWVTPPMVAAAIGAARSARVAYLVLPWASAATLLDGMLGFALHLRGIKRMPGALANLRFNITMGPPLFAPLLFSAVGLLGLIASLLRRER
jgi:hypothetical protein